jgi:hypothetical protein
MKSRTRLLLLLGAAVVLWFARDALVPAGVVGAEAARGGRSATSTASTRPAFDPATAELCVAPRQMPSRGEVASAIRFDPFTAWQPAPKLAPPKATVAAPVQVPTPPPPPPPPPPLPYRYLGALNEKGVPPSVFLALGSTLITAKAGDTLEGGFRLDSITPRELTFMHLQQKQTVRLRVEGETQ